MRIAIMGAGALGACFGGWLAKGGGDVVFIARGAQLSALREAGLAVESPLGDFRLDQVQATDSPDGIGSVDVAVVAVKLWGTEAAGRAIESLIGSQTAVLSLQNGIDSEAVLAKLLGQDHIWGGVAQWGAEIVAPGRVRHVGASNLTLFGELDNRRTPRAEAFLEFCRQSGIEAIIPGDISTEIWKKFVFLAAFSAVCCLTRLPIGPILIDDRSRSLFAEAIAEVAAVARAEGVKLPEETEAETLARAQRLPPVAKASMLRDLSAGRALELEWLSGAVVRLGRQHGIATPVHCVAVGALGPSAQPAASG